MQPCLRLGRPPSRFQRKNPYRMWEKGPFTGLPLWLRERAQLRTLASDDSEMGGGGFRQCAQNGLQHFFMDDRVDANVEDCIRRRTPLEKNQVAEVGVKRKQAPVRATSQFQHCAVRNAGAAQCHRRYIVT